MQYIWTDECVGLICEFRYSLVSIYRSSKHSLSKSWRLWHEKLQKKLNKTWRFHTTVWSTPFKSQTSLVYMGVSKASKWGPVWEVHIWETDASHVLFLMLLLGPFNPLLLLELAPFCDESSACRCLKTTHPIQLLDDYSAAVLHGMTFMSHDMGPKAFPTWTVIGKGAVVVSSPKTNIEQLQNCIIKWYLCIRMSDVFG